MLKVKSEVEEIRGNTLTNTDQNFNSCCFTNQSMLPPPANYINYKGPREPRKKQLKLQTAKKGKAGSQ